MAHHKISLWIAALAVLLTIGVAHAQPPSSASASPQSARSGPPGPPRKPCCWPPPCKCTISMAGCPTVTLRVENIAKAKGWGGHFSLGANENGYGGPHAECHITGGEGPNQNVHLLCYDGFLNPSAHVDQYEIGLGVRKEVDWAEFEIRGGQVAVTVQRRATNPYNSENVPYVIRSFFPLRDETNFCSRGTVYYQPNGVLSGQSNRSGSGYEVMIEK